MALSEVRTVGALEITLGTLGQDTPAAELHWPAYISSVIITRPTARSEDGMTNGVTIPSTRHRRRTTIAPQASELSEVTSSSYFHPDVFLLSTY